VSFRYKAHKDTTPQYGLIAEQVAEVNPNLVIYDADGKPYTVRYDAVNAMLLNEFLKEHKKVEEQQATIAKLKATVAEQQVRATKQETATAQQRKQIEVLTAGLQKVSAQVEMNRTAPRIVVNER
jgi:septal ring factor EnvC (AmiA/AmiB activator)